MLAGVVIRQRWLPQAHHDAGIPSASRYSYTPHKFCNSGRCINRGQTQARLAIRKDDATNLDGFDEEMDMVSEEMTTKKKPSTRRSKLYDDVVQVDDGLPSTTPQDKGASTQAEKKVPKFLRQELLAKYRKRHEQNVFSEWYDTRQTFLLDLLDPGQRISTIRGFLESNRQGTAYIPTRRIQKYNISTNKDEFVTEVWRGGQSVLVELSKGAVDLNYMLEWCQFRARSPTQFSGWNLQHVEKLQTTYENTDNGEADGYFDAWECPVPLPQTLLDEIEAWQNEYVVITKDQVLLEAAQQLRDQQQEGEATSMAPEADKGQQEGSSTSQQELDWSLDQMEGGYGDTDAWEGTSGPTPGAPLDGLEPEREVVIENTFKVGGENIHALRRYIPRNLTEGPSRRQAIFVHNRPAHAFTPTYGTRRQYSVQVDSQFEDESVIMLPGSANLSSQGRMWELSAAEIPLVEKTTHEREMLLASVGEEVGEGSYKWNTGDQLLGLVNKGGGSKRLQRKKRPTPDLDSLQWGGGRQQQQGAQANAGEEAE